MVLAIVVLSSVASTRMRALTGLRAVISSSLRARLIDLVVDLDLPADAIEVADLMRAVRLPGHVREEEAVALRRGNADQSTSNFHGARPTVTSASMAWPSRTTISSSSSVSKSAPSTASAEDGILGQDARPSASSSPSAE